MCPSVTMVTSGQLPWLPWLMYNVFQCLQRRLEETRSQRREVNFIQNIMRNVLSEVGPSMLMSTACQMVNFSFLKPSPNLTRHPHYQYYIVQTHNTTSPPLTLYNRTTP